MKIRSLIAVAVISIAVVGCDVSQADRPPVEPPSDDRPGVVFASIDLTCKGGGKFSLTTGTIGGICETVADPNNLNTTRATCKDDNGNTSDANCTTNGGQGSCSRTTGSGTCTAK